MAAAIDYTYRYPFASNLTETRTGANLSLATFTRADESPYFFDGRMRDPRALADMFIVLSDIVRTHFFMPMPLEALDPVLTSNDSMLRMEGFSACCGVYARVDMSRDAFEGDVKGRGTTNVDFNDPMRAALRRIRRQDDVQFAVGKAEVALEVGDTRVVEKKVKLPIRWVKGFSEVQAYQPRLEMRYELPAAQAIRLLRGMPGTQPKSPLYVTGRTSSARLTHRPQVGAVRFLGPHRVRVLEPLLVNAESLRIWADDATGTSAWEVVSATERFLLLISPEIYRGFSGEGQVLETLAKGNWQNLLAAVRAQVNWQNEIDSEGIAAAIGEEVSDVEAALAALGSRGLAGYDVNSRHYFHRELPFDQDQVEALQPRRQAEPVAGPIRPVAAVARRWQGDTRRRSARRIPVFSWRQRGRPLCPHPGRWRPLHVSLVQQASGRARSLQAHPRGTDVSRQGIRGTVTPAAFEELIRHAPGEAFVAALNPLDEESRKSYRKIVKAVRKDVESTLYARYAAGTTAEEFNKRQEAGRKWKAANPHIEANAVLGLLACGTAAEAHRAPMWQLHGEHADLVASVLIARNPTWLGTWVDKHLGGEFPNLSWETVRALIRAGVIEKPSAEGYARLFIHAMRGYDYQHPEAYVPTSERLLAEPEFLDDEVWRLFEFENEAFTGDWQAKHREAPGDYETWPDAIARLAADGHLDRDRLLDTILDALQQEIKQNQLSAYGKLHDRLAPTDAELKARARAYSDLLVAPKSPVISFAVRTLSRMHRKGLLDGPLFLDAARPVFGNKAKGNAVQVLRLATQLAAADAALAADAVSLAIAAMPHPSPDVQELALDLIDEKFAMAGDALRSEFEGRIAFLATKLQPRAQALLGTSPLADNLPDDAPDTSDLEEQIESLPASLRRIVGLQTAATMPTPLDYELSDLPCAASREALPRVETRDELLELAAQLIEKVDSGHQVEVLLDGIARFGTDRSGAFAKFADPLVQRMEQGQASRYGLAAGWGGSAVALIDLVLTWLTGIPHDSRTLQHYSEAPRETFAISRLRETLTIHARGIALPLLSTPSYTSGWIEPLDLVKRMADYERLGSNVRARDLMQAFLRLAPGRREAALEAAGELDEDSGRILKFALGGNEGPTKRDRKVAYVWLCAARARQPRGSLRDLLDPIAGEIPDMADLIEPAAWRWSAHVEKREGYRLSRIEYEGGQLIEFDAKSVSGMAGKVRKFLSGTAWDRWPLAAMNVRAKQRWFSMYEMGSPWRIEWLAMQQPLLLESYFSVAAQMLDLRSDESSSTDMPFHAYLAALFDPTRRWGEMAVLTLCLGLVSRSADTNGFAVDALIPAIETGHADIGQIGRAFAKLFEDDGYKINRFGPAMMQVLEVSLLHRWWTARLVDDVVTRFDSLPKGAHYLYEVALECLPQLGARPSQAMVRVLRRHKGSTKTAKLARELLALEGPPVDEPANAVLAAAVQGRVALARKFTT